MKQPKFDIGDRVTYKSPELPYQKKRGIGEVVWETADHYYIIWADDPKMECPHLKVVVFDPSGELVKVAQPSKIDVLPEIAKPKKPRKPKPSSLTPGIKVGDHVRNLESGDIGEVTHLSDRCITIKNRESIESHNLELGIPKLEKIVKTSDSDLTIGDRVIFVAKGFGREGKIGTIAQEKFDKRKGLTRQTIVYDDGTIDYYHYQGAGVLEKFLEEPTKIDSFPETAAPDLHGYFEHYQPVIKGAKPYWYRRYVYVHISGKLVHHHVPNKMVESIETLWRSGATPKEICLALGKSGK